MVRVIALPLLLCLPLLAKAQPVAIHYWHFNTLTSVSPTTVPADMSRVGTATIEYIGTGAGYMDRVEDQGTTLNALDSEEAGHSLRARNPSNTRHLTLRVPTTGFEGIRFSYAVRRTTNGATINTLEYRVSESAEWIAIGNQEEVSLDFSIVSYDLSSLPLASNNEGFALRIAFGGTNASLSEGNNRFDNIRVEGIPLAPTLAPLGPDGPPARALRVAYQPGHVRLHSPFAVPSTLTIYSMRGAPMGVYPVSGMGYHELPFTGIRGVYIARLTSPQGSIAGRFVVH